MTKPLFHILIFTLTVLHLRAQKTEIIHLSGKGYDDVVQWEFMCSAGRNSGEWHQIPVPSCWEQHGFGEYNYGHDPYEKRLNETGFYRYKFSGNPSWKDKHLELVFEGAMTDCEVKLNGQFAGPIHQGAFYQFRYDVSDIIKTEGENLLEVMVDKHSENESVNQAERNADYWIFGGIFRPVYLEVNPKHHIEHVAIDARADGSFSADVTLKNIPASGALQLDIIDPSGQITGTEKFALNTVDSIVFQLTYGIKDPFTWNQEFPHLYTAIFRLLDGDKNPLHIHSQKFGFRTVEIRAEDGIYVNGTKIKFKGVNRHSFHPDHGRTSSKSLSIEAINLMKDMNMNAVRMSHYPPDPHFLEVCDSLGLFVINELAGWQTPSYDSVIGRKLLEEMIRRDVNHPSIILWSNGNEGGWNTAYDADFPELDIQKREVIHPWGAFGKMNTAHYVDYDYLSADNHSQRLIFFPTEMLHGLYDGGHGAGLEDFWLRIWNNPLSAGGFLWVFADEAIKRTDTGELDTDGNHAPDGILGPYHEKEGSFYAVRDIWSPVYIPHKLITNEFNGILPVTNRFHFTSFDQCEFLYSWIKLRGPDGEMDSILSEGAVNADPLTPGQKGWLQIRKPVDWTNADVLAVIATDPNGRLINHWRWPVRSPEIVNRQTAQEAVQNPISHRETNEEWLFQTGELEIRFRKRDGLLVGVSRRSEWIPLSFGPIFTPQEFVTEDIKLVQSNDNFIIHVDNNDGNSRFQWIIKPGGLFDLEVRYKPPVESPFSGISFSYPENEMQGIKWMGDGPYRVWKNRMKGVHFGVWEKEYNNTMTGHSEYVYPELKGYHSNLYWATFNPGKNKEWKVFSHSKDIFLRLLTPEDPPDPRHTAVAHPLGDLSFLHAIPPIGTKFHRPEELGPQGNPTKFDRRRVDNGYLTMSLSFDFR